MPLRQLIERDVYDICERAAGGKPDGVEVGRVVAQAHNAVSASTYGDPARVYAAAIVMQTMLYEPVPRARVPFAAWACGLAALQENGLDARPGYDPAPRLRAMMADKMNGLLVLATALDLIDDAIA
jgi:hypothetical protein